MTSNSEALPSICGATLTLYRANGFSSTITFVIFQPTSRDAQGITTIEISALVFWLVCSIWFICRRSKEPIRSRHPKLAILLPATWMMYTATSNFTFINPDTPCYVITILLSFFAYLGSGVFFVRILVLYIDANVTANSCKVHSHITKQMRSLDKVDEEDSSSTSALFLNQEGQRDPKLNNWCKYKRFFNDKYYFLGIGIILFIFMVPVIATQLALGGATSKRVDFICHVEIQGLLQYIQITELSVEALTCLFMLWKIRKIKETLGIKKECMSQALSIVIGMCFYLPILHPESKSAVDKFFCDNFHFNGYILTYELFPQVLFCFSALLYPVILTYQPFSSFRQQASCLRPQHRLSEDALIQTFSSKDPLLELKALLSFQEGFDLFKNRLQAEFSVENILFWEAVHLNKQNKMDARTIYENYIRLASPLAVNISAPARRAIQRHFEGEGAVTRDSISSTGMWNLSITGGGGAAAAADMQARDCNSSRSSASSSSILSSPSKIIEGKAVPEDPTIFDEACAEVFKLMARDSFLRFCTTPEFQAFWLQYRDRFRNP
eukprot:TRINITY_DN4208_c0_g1_i4.p1 TRINITY_DN4208_c0_g1~~TRINITY_DN4208_c0_g1_i4.p1  ORF type:complete len:553 (+),score=103.94 TRINITY_DN4208_c0_g1_i4:82-1740(+)